MAKTVNRVTLLGNLGRAPEVKATGGGTLVATFSVATANRYKDGQGNWQEQAEWHNCVAFGKLAEIVRDYVSKGSKLYLEGRMQTRSWDDKDSGKKQYRTEVAVSELTLLGAPREKGVAPQADPYSREAVYGDQDASDDVPF
jgi:single-strand DNA-binding protein